MRDKIEEGFAVLSSDNYDLYVQRRGGKVRREIRGIEERKKVLQMNDISCWGETTVHIAFIFLRGNPSHTSSLREKIANYRIIGRV